MLLLKKKKKIPSFMSQISFPWEWKVAGDVK